MSHTATNPPAPRQDMPGFMESYYSSTIELHDGALIGEVSLGHLPNDEVIELLRMRTLWRRC